MTDQPLTRTDGGHLNKFSAVKAVAPWVAIGLSIAALAVSLIEWGVGTVETVGSNGIALRQQCLAWAEFVITEQGRHIPDFRIDDEGALFSHFLARNNL
jgi:hypothetical protein